MVDLGMGAMVLGLLIPTNNLILSVYKYKPHLGMGVPAMSVFANTIVVLSWGIWLKDYAYDTKLFIGGILLAVFASMIIKLNKLIKIK